MISEAENDPFFNVVRIKNDTFIEVIEPAVYRDIDIKCTDYKEIKRSQESAKIDGITGNRIKCDECDLTFSERGNLNQHKRNIHEGIKYPCHYCDYQAPRSATLHRHIKAKKHFPRKNQLEKIKLF